MSLELFLVNNDPLSTNLMTSLGKTMYSVQTPRERTTGTAEGLLFPDNLALGQQSDTINSSAPTKVHRFLNSLAHSWGQESTEIGSIEPSESGGGVSGCATVNILLDQDRCFQLKLGEGELKSVETSTGLSVEYAKCSAVNEHSPGQIALHKDSWGFLGPDERKYIWQMFVKAPILVLADGSFIPIARYRRAKVGIVSRPRKGFLEILPEGLPVVDMVVVTFVAFMKYRVPSNLLSFELFPSGDETGAPDEGLNANAHGHLPESSPRHDMRAP